jgi:hypothetical protein
MKTVQKKFRKIFIKWIFLSTFLLSALLVLIKLLIPHQYQFLEPISIYGTLLSSVIFIYWFILAPALAEYKESEKLLTDIKSSLINIREDASYFKWLKTDFELENFYHILCQSIDQFYHSIADDVDADYIHTLSELNILAMKWEKLWITANHIIRLKQEISIVKKSFLRITEIKRKDSMPKIIHHLKDFITFMVIVTLLFLNIWKSGLDIVGQIQESIMLFLISFLYIYLSFIINGFENPFDKRRFHGFLDLTFLMDFVKDLKKKKGV